jgi:hypothetical protein
MSMAWYRWCGRAVPTYPNETTVVYLNWLERNRALVDKLESTPGFKEALDRTVDGMGKPSPEATPQGLRVMCDRITVTLSPPPAHVGKTPEETWAGFLEALRAGDASRVVGYFIIETRESVIDNMKRLGPDGMKRVADNYKSFEMRPHGKELLVEGYATTKDGRLESVWFSHSSRVDGWLIQEFEYWPGRLQVAPGR